MKKRFFIASILLILFSTYHVKFDNNIKKFNIQDIIIENNEIIKDENIKTKLSFLYETNIFFLDKKNIEKSLKEIQFI